VFGVGRILKVYRVYYMEEIDFRMEEISGGGEENADQQENRREGGGGFAIDFSQHPWPSAGMSYF
jgi:hypothetical protein